jgi:K+-transporting ATPase ATPase C chain
MWKQFRISVLLLLTLSVLTGLVYPLVFTAIAQLLFPAQANGSLIVQNGVVVGSRLIGQNFDDPRYFWSRPSATNPPYNASSSSGSNLGPMNPAFKLAVASRLKNLLAADPGNSQTVPVDLVTASASGLDPHISIAAAQYQIRRVARLRSISEEKLAELVVKHTTQRFLGILGEPVINVLELNLALDNTFLTQSSQKTQRSSKSVLINSSVSKISSVNKS